MKRHENREKAMMCVYQFLIYERELEELIHDNYTDEEIQEDPYIQSVIQTAIKNRVRYSGYSDQVLDEWSFDRLGFIEQSLILCGCAEFDLKEQLAAVIIDEYVRLAKKYCEEDSYKLINGVLDRI